MEVKAYLSILRRRAWIILVAILVCSAVITFGFDKIPPVYEASTSLRVLTPIEGGATYVQFQTYYGDRLANTYVQLASSNLVLQELQKRLGIETLPKISVTAAPNSEIVSIIVQDSNPLLAMNAANTLASILSSQSVNPYLNTVDTAPQVLQSRLETMQADYLQARKTADDLVKPYSDISAQITVLNRTITQLEQNYQDLRRQVDDSQAQQAAALYAGEKAQQQAVQDMLNQKLDTVSAELDKNKVQLETLSAQQTQYLQELNGAQREADAKESQYNNMLNQVDLARIAENIRTNSTGTMVIDKAEMPVDPIGLKRWMAIILGALIGLVAGIILAFIVESLDTTVYSVDEVEAIAKAPVLGTIPKTRLPSPAKLDLFGSFGDNPPLRESFRSIAASLVLQTRGTKGNAIVVTSAEPMEGKSVFVSYLAIALGQSRRKVVVVDGDMRLSRQHLLFHLPNEKGLSDVLAEQASLEDAIQPTGISNVSVLTGGTEYANPVELLVGNSAEAVVKRLTEDYDFVLVDSPSYLAVADSEVLAGLSKGVILIARRKESNKEAIRDTVRLLREAKANLIGVVVNSVKPKPRYAYYHRSRGGRVLRQDIVDREQTPLVEGKITS